MFKSGESMEEKKVLLWKWYLHKDSLFVGYTAQDSPCSKLALFDMDGTLINNKSGKKNPVNSSDWMWWDSVVPKKLRELKQQGFRVIITTNQKGVSLGHTTTKELSQKVEQFSSELGIEISCLMATQDDNFRKPLTGMWQYIGATLNKDFKIDMDASFYVGDAAGRVSGKQKDHSDCDRYFALNSGLKFFTPEEFFLGAKNITLPPVQKSLFELLSANTQLFVSDEYEFDVNKHHMVFMVGPPGCGKSTFVSTHMPDHLRINHDTVKNINKCKELISNYIQEKGRLAIVIDNTNCTQQQRHVYLELAKALKYVTVCLVISVDKHTCMLMDSTRTLNPHRQHHSKRVGSIPIHKFFKDYEPPSAEEFDFVYRVNVTAAFRNEEEKNLYKCMR
jgi:bifunctional polynucleotide phosphatase/kinase